MTDETNQPIAEILPLEQHEQDEHDHESCGTGRLHERTHPAEGREAGQRLARNHDRLRHRAPGSVVDANVLLDLIERGLQPLDGAAAARPAHVPDLLPDVGPVGNKVGAQIARLSQNRPGRETQTGEHERHHDEHRCQASDSSLKPDHRRSQDEGDENREADRNQDGLCPMEYRHHERAAGEGRPGAKRAEPINHARRN